MSICVLWWCVDNICVHARYGIFAGRRSGSSTLKAGINNTCMQYFCMGILRSQGATACFHKPVASMWRACATHPYFVTMIGALAMSLQHCQQRLYCFITSAYFSLYTLMTHQQLCDPEPALSPLFTLLTADTALSLKWAIS